MKYTILAVFIAWSSAAVACSESEIHAQTTTCYTDCVSRYFNEPDKQSCIAGCVATQDRQRDACGITCTIIAGSKICH
jgi:hypothetical protein